MLNNVSNLVQGKSLQGDPAAALLEVLDPEQNNSFTDQYPLNRVDLCLLFHVFMRQDIYRPVKVNSSLATIQIHSDTSSRI